MCQNVIEKYIKKSIIEDYNLLQTYRNKIDGYKPLKSQFENEISNKFMNLFNKYKYLNDYINKYKPDVITNKFVCDIIKTTDEDIKDLQARLDRTILVRSNKSIGNGSSNGSNDRRNSKNSRTSRNGNRNSSRKTKNIS